MSNGPQNRPPLLPYADSPARQGIIYERRPDGLVIRIPAAGRLRPLFTAGLIDRIGEDWVRLFRLLLSAAMLLSFWLIGKRFPLTVFAIFVAWVVVVLSTAGGLGVRRIPAIITLDARSLSITQLDPLIGVPTTWDRSIIYDVRFVPHASAIAIHAHGADLYEFRPVRDEPTLRWLANELRMGLGLPVDPPKPSTAGE